MLTFALQNGAGWQRDVCHSEELYHHSCLVQLYGAPPQRPAGQCNPCGPSLEKSEMDCRGHICPRNYGLYRLGTEATGQSFI